MNVNCLQALYLAAEADPFVKVGGLGDVAGSLPLALSRLGVQIKLTIPLHGSIELNKWGFDLACEFPLIFNKINTRVKVFAARIENLYVYLISGGPILQDGPVYSTDDIQNGEKFAFFSFAALELARQMGWTLDILHANDWHTALAVYELSILRKKKAAFQKTASIMTVHNLPYLGPTVRDLLSVTSKPNYKINQLPDWARDLPLPIGLLLADWITTVSPNYAREIQTPAFGAGLDSFLRTRSGQISGILNGLDTNHWDPATDPSLPIRYSIEDLSPRIKNKYHLQEELALPVVDDMLIGIVSRMDEQKGIDLVIEAFIQLARLSEDQTPRYQLVMLGTGSSELEAQAHQLEKEFPACVRVVTRFDPPLSRRIFAGADLMLIPSRYEPCGLTQMIAMRYGCVPLGRATGGLRDTIVDVASCEQGTGFLFEEASSAGLLSGLMRAIQAYNHRTEWKAIQIRGMQRDFSWIQSAQETVKLYNYLTKKNFPKSMNRKI